MEAAIEHFILGLNGFWLGIVIVGSLVVLGKAADWLVDEAVGISTHWGIPKSVVGATIVSLGTTTPETAVSVAAALQGSPGLALGNAVGSIICDTGLILGLAIVISPMRLDPNLVNRQGWVQLGSALLLVLLCTPFSHLSNALTTGGTLPQWAGWLFLVLLGCYIVQSIRWARAANAETVERGKLGDTYYLLAKLFAAIGLVVGSSTVLIPAVREAAVRMSVPEGIIAATLVAFGTSLPELVTVVTAARRGHGELGVGNVIGADILNVFFVSGSAAAVTAGGLAVEPDFFRLYFPAMVFVLIVFRIGVLVSGERMKRPFGFVLLAAYAVATALGYL